MSANFELIAFYSNPKTLDELLKAGIDGIIIDWENKGKLNRQSLYNTQVNEHTISDLEFASKKNVPNLICRINGPSYWSTEEIDKAIDLGANELLIPMIKKVEEVAFVLNYVRDRVKVGVMLETSESLAIADQLNALPIHRFFVGLNDLSIQRKSRNLFQPFIDGTIETLRPKITKPFGIAGLTHPMGGVPIPCTHLIGQMKRFDASFGFLRRAFYKDLATYTAADIIKALRESFDHNTMVSTTKITEEEKIFFSQELI
ncbi:hypothetical protein GCM10022393_41430 [Aquimarina addita]|uniref:HpcH/HpaI aldolase/citrate lyase domain-containing protein n=1 Tax=Aquimarina addita TaxID=870485 RepID=A0ABP6UY72_9FLAO